jgi:hypothetical protein
VAHRVTAPPGAKRLHVLVLEGERPVEKTVDALVVAGHRVSRCCQPTASTLPCNTLAAGQPCPLDGIGVDLVLDLRAREAGHPASLAEGAACAERHAAPHVVVHDE